MSCLHAVTPILDRRFPAEHERRNVGVSLVLFSFVATNRFGTLAPESSPSWPACLCSIQHACFVDSGVKVYIFGFLSSGSALKVSQDRFIPTNPPDFGAAPAAND